jgi:hypothetical protein
VHRDLIVRRLCKIAGDQQSATLSCARLVEPVTGREKVTGVYVQS